MVGPTDGEDRQCYCCEMIQDHLNQRSKRWSEDAGTSNAMAGPAEGEDSASWTKAGSWFHHRGA